MSHVCDCGRYLLLYSKSPPVISDLWQQGNFIISSGLCKSRIWETVSWQFWLFWGVSETAARAVTEGELTQPRDAWAFFPLQVASGRFYVASPWIGQFELPPSTAASVPSVSL